MWEIERVPSEVFGEFEEQYLRVIFKLENGNILVLEHEIDIDDEEGLNNEDFYIEDIEDLLAAVDPKRLKTNNEYLKVFNEAFYKAKKEIVMKKNIILFISHIPYTTKDYILIEDEAFYNRLKKKGDDEISYYVGKYIQKSMNKAKHFWKYAKIKDGTYRKVRGI